MRHILVATDGSSGGDRALDFAAALAKNVGCVLSVVNVTDELSLEDVKVLAQVESRLIEEMDNEVLERAKRRVEGNGGPAIQTHVAFGSPAAGILETAQTCSPDLVVVGRRGRGQLAGLLLGSVSQKLAGLCPCPVVIVP